MASNAVRERLGQDVGQWLTDGLVSKATHDLLRERYGARDFGIGQAIRSLGIAGGLLAFFGLFGLVAAISRSKMVAAVLMIAVGAGLTAAGIHLATDKLGRYIFSSKAVLAVGALTAALGVGVALDARGLETHQVITLTGPLVLIPIAILAYRFGNTFLLVLGLLEFFHWVGTWNQMWGRSTYELDIQDPRMMSLAALAAIVVGIYHERELRYKTGRFFQAYETTGLIYLNLSLLILTIEGNPHWGDAGLWIIVLFVASISQIVAGAGLHNSLMTGFGVTTFAVNVYTRYYETFWHRMHAGVFFLLGGLSLLVAGALCEIFLRQKQRSAP
jgi:uncharacterized membrane protein